MSGQFSTTPNTLVGAGAYSLSDQQALRVGEAGTVALEHSGRYSVESTFRPYVFGQSDLRLRPAV